MPPLRFLADESCDFAVVRALRAAGHDVAAVGEVQQRSVDRELIRAAAQDKRILLTEDKDFGWLVFASDEDSPGVILIRYPGNARETLAHHVGQIVAEYGEALHNAFVVIQPGHVRLNRRPKG